RDAARYEGVLTENLFGDIASDVGAAVMGGLGRAASANLCPETGFGLFEPVHGSAPDIAGTGTADPHAAIASLAMLLDHLGYGKAAFLLGACLREVPFCGSTLGYTASVLERLSR